jgi:hypothetical protein
MICASMLQIREHEHSNDFNFIILFVGILLLYAIKLDDVNLFASFFISINYWIECISLFLLKTKNLRFL